MSMRPSVKQMAHRANEGHYKTLKALRDDATFVGQADSDNTVIKTLRGWECVDDGHITERGLELIAAYEKKWRLRRCTCGGSDYASCVCNLAPSEWLAYAKTNPLVDQGLTLSKQMPES